jgi:hypothetical protein
LYENLCRALAFPALSQAERRLIAALSQDQNLTNRMLGLRAGTMTQAEFRAAAPTHILSLFDATQVDASQTTPRMF